MSCEFIRGGPSPSVRPGLLPSRSELPESAPQSQLLLRDPPHRSERTHRVALVFQRTDHPLQSVYCPASERRLSPLWDGEAPHLRTFLVSEGRSPVGPTPELIADAPIRYVWRRLPRRGGPEACIS